MDREQSPAGTTLSVEALLALAAEDEAFARALRERRAETLAACGSALSAADRAVLMAVSPEALDQMVARLGEVVECETRREVLVQMAAATVAGVGIATGVTVSGCDRAAAANPVERAGGGGGSGGSGGVRPSPATGSRPGRHGVKLPKVIVGKCRVAGPLPPGVARRILRRHTAALGYCYALALRKNKRLQGKMQLTQSVGANGRVTSVKVTSSLGDKGLDACVLRYLRRVRFPRYAKPSVVSVSLLFRRP